MDGKIITKIGCKDCKAVNDYDGEIVDLDAAGVEKFVDAAITHFKNRGWTRGSVRTRADTWTCPEHSKETTP